MLITLLLHSLAMVALIGSADAAEKLSAREIGVKQGQLAVIRKELELWDFSSVAKRMSIMPSAKFGGYLGVFDAKDVQKEVASALTGQARGSLIEIGSDGPSPRLLQKLEALAPGTKLVFQYALSKSKEAALALAGELKERCDLEQAGRGGKHPEVLFSNGEVTARMEDLEPVLAYALGSLMKSQCSSIIESERGYYLLRRRS